MKKKIVIKKEAELKILAREIAVRLKPNKTETRVLALRGNLGSGKTAFTKALVKFLGGKETVVSPTFIIMNKYKLDKKEGFENCYHLDVYRLQKEEELDILGWKEIIKNPKNLIIVEWADKVSKAMPQDTIYLDFEHGEKEGERVIIRREI